MARFDEHESFASVHRKARNELLRQELNREIGKIWDATHCAARGDTIYMYGSKREAEAFADGLHRSGIVVREMTDKEKHEQAKAKRRAYGNP